MTYQMGYLDMNREHIKEYEDCNHVVTSENVCIGRRARRGRHWSSKWNVDFEGVIVGYTDNCGILHGENVRKQYNQVQGGQQDWCVVDYDNGKRSIYPIGAQGIFALSYID